MSSQYRKIKYQEEGPYGSSVDRYLYIWSHDTVDIVHVYDYTGNELFTFSETGFDMGQALSVAFTDWADNRMEKVYFDEWEEIINKKENKMNKVEEAKNELIKVLECQVMDLSMMSKIELGDDVIAEIIRLKKIINE
jgi:hypothetical protein